MRGMVDLPTLANGKLPPLARKSSSLDPLPGTWDAQHQQQPNPTACTTDVAAEGDTFQPAVMPRREAKDDAAGVPVFVMLPLDTVGCHHPALPL